MVKVKHKFLCSDCGYESPKWYGKCPGCGAWNSMVEEVEKPVKTQGMTSGIFHAKEKPESIINIESGKEPRIQTGIGELNRVLGGGVVPGSLVLVGGDPGIGKSTLLLQTSHEMARSGLRVLYISGEESVRQTKLRAERLGALSAELFVLCESSMDGIEEAIEQVKPDFLVIDSIQTVYLPEVTSAPGSVSQVRECTARFMRIAKGQGIATVLVGHVTKEGAIAGPRLLEHMVDCVLYFEGERHHSYRLLRAERPLGVAGSTVVASMEGTRPMLVELQALISATHFPSPRRMATGVDYQRMNLIIAVLEKRMGMFLQNQDAYVNLAGGVKLDEPAVDLAIAVSVASSFRDLPTKPYDVFFGEVGLTGEVRAVSRAEQRVKEAAKLGFKRVILPEKSMKGWKGPQGIQLIGVNTVADALAVALD